MNAEDRREQLRALTAEAARQGGRPPEGAGPDVPAAGDLYVLPETADFPVEWLLLERASDDRTEWLAVPADTNPLRGPGDVWLGPAAAAGPLCLRCRFGVRLPSRILRGRRRTGRVPAETAARALATLREHERGALDPGPLAEEVATDPEYLDWESTVLTPARETVAGLAAAVPEPLPDRPRPAVRPWIAAAAALLVLSVGLGAWNLALRQRLDQLSAPILLGSSQEVVAGTEDRGPVTLRIRPADQRLLVFVVLSGTVADHERYRVELADGEGAAVWRSPEVERGAVPELNLVIPRRLLEGPNAASRLIVFGIEGDRAQRLAEVPLQIAHAEDAP